MLAHQRREPAAWVPWTGPEDAGNTRGTGMCGGLAVPPTPPSSGLPPRMQKGRGADTPVLRALTGQREGGL